MAFTEHKAAAVPPSSLRVAVLTVSDTRTPETDRGGDLIVRMVREAGLQVVDRALVRDEPDAIRDRVVAWLPRILAAGGDASPDALLITGGTGLAPRDTTVDVVAPLFERRLDGFGELFRMLSFAEIGAAAMLSRAVAGIVRGVPVFVMPGSTAAIRLALEKLILPELGHLISELRRSADPPGHIRGGKDRHGDGPDGGSEDGAQP